MAAENIAVKVKLSTGKECLLREYRIKHSNLAVAAAAARSGENQMVFANNMAQELIKILIIQVNGKNISAVEAEDLDSLFTAAEYSQLQRVLKKMMGDDEVGKFQVEMVTSGGQ